MTSPCGAEPGLPVVVGDDPSPDRRPRAQLRRVRIESPLGRLQAERGEVVPGHEQPVAARGPAGLADRERHHPETPATPSKLRTGQLTRSALRASTRQDEPVSARGSTMSRPPLSADAGKRRQDRCLQPGKHRGVDPMPTAGDGTMTVAGTGIVGNGAKRVSANPGSWLQRKRAVAVAELPRSAGPSACNTLSMTLASGVRSPRAIDSRAARWSRRRGQPEKERHPFVIVELESPIEDP